MLQQCTVADEFRNSLRVQLTGCQETVTSLSATGVSWHTQVAAGLTDAALPKGNCAVRIMLFVGGPTTEGGGQVVDKELSEPIRSHKARRPPLFPVGPCRTRWGG